MATRLTFRGTKQDVVERLRLLAKGVAEGSDAGNAIVISMGMAALADIRDAYKIKSRRGTDAMGIRWDELSPVTVAKRRQSKLSKSALIKKREKQRKIAEAEAFKRLSISLPERQARKRAKQIADLSDVEILRDKGFLFNSLEPGVASGSTYTKPSKEGGQDQIFEVARGKVVLGSNRPYAATHQHGNPAKKIPARPFLPTKDSDIPEGWIENWLDAGSITVSELIKATLQ